MTTIAYRDGVMASDSMMTRGSEPCYGVSKMFKVHGALVGIAGSLCNLAPFHEFLEENLLRYGGVGGLWRCWHDAPNHGSGFSAMIVSSSGSIWSVEDSPPVRLYRDFEAIGSGGAYAMGAMHMGATPQQAVRIARKMDVDTGGNIITIQLAEENKS